MARTCRRTSTARAAADGAVSRPLAKVTAARQELLACCASPPPTHRSGPLARARVHVHVHGPRTHHEPHKAVVRKVDVADLEHRPRDVVVWPEMLSNRIRQHVNLHRHTTRTRTKKKLVRRRCSQTTDRAPCARTETAGANLEGSMRDGRSTAAALATAGAPGTASVADGRGAPVTADLSGDGGAAESAATGPGAAAGSSALMLFWRSRTGGVPWGRKDTSHSARTNAASSDGERRSAGVATTLLCERQAPAPCA